MFEMWSVLADVVRHEASWWTDSKYAKSGVGSAMSAYHFSSFSFYKRVVRLCLTIWRRYILFLLSPVPILCFLEGDMPAQLS